MSNILSAFKDKKAFIPFITCGDPDLSTTEKIVYEMAENGADLIELGIPFSDPVAEGLTIQKSSKNNKYKNKCTVPHMSQRHGYGVFVFYNSPIFTKPNIYAKIKN